MFKRTIVVLGLLSALIVTGCETMQPTPSASTVNSPAENKTDVSGRLQNSQTTEKNDDLVDEGMSKPLKGEDSVVKQPQASDATSEGSTDPEATLVSSQAFNSASALQPSLNRAVTGNTKEVDGMTISELADPSPWVSSGLRLRPDDRIRFSVWGYPELDHVAQVQANGNATFPLIGEVQVANNTITEAREKIVAMLTHTSSDSSFKLRFGDVVKLFVWNNPELSVSSVVQPDGSLYLPMVGQLQVTDTTIGELNKTVNQRLSKYINHPKAWLMPEVRQRKVLQDPQVSLLPVELIPRKVAIIGEVQINGQQPLTSGMKVLDVLANANPFDQAALSSVILIRESDSKTPSYKKLDIAGYLKGEKPNDNLFVQEGDLIVVPKTFIAKVGYFIEMFFTRTKPVYDWYLANRQAWRYEEITNVNLEVNKAAKEAFEQSTVSPSVP